MSALSADDQLTLSTEATGPTDATEPSEATGSTRSRRRARRAGAAEPAEQQSAEPADDKGNGTGGDKDDGTGGGKGDEKAVPRRDPEAVLADLNPSQRAAVMHEGHPLLVVAGAGSGKTRVLTRRIAWLLAQRDARPSSIIAITFTNKAAG
ncbi:MAG TPA: UvrD-helicase domain-containing protein, partial [Actinopolymorphaceae bacterium]|nr:UvrD-helicase domain-containing protein [Actinopolymorphaceae bacterium]